MRLTSPRIAPLTDAEMTPEQTEILGDRFRKGPVFNVFRTLAHSPKGYRKFMGWGGYILSDHNSLKPRERELVILRAGYNWKSGYEWAQHARIGKECGLTDAEIERIKEGPGAQGWSAADRALLQATDELTSDAFITDETWAALSDFSERQRMDLILTVGQYTMVSMLLNSCGVQLDDGLTLDPDLVK